jgi:hypothetical protein
VSSAALYSISMRADELVYARSPYDMSKGAQAQLVRCIAAGGSALLHQRSGENEETLPDNHCFSLCSPEYGPNKIRCNGICPT